MFSIHQRNVDSTINTNSRFGWLIPVNKTTDHVSARLEVFQLEVKVSIRCAWLGGNVFKLLVGHLSTHNKSCVCQFSIAISLGFEFSPGRLRKCHCEISSNRIKVVVMGCSLLKFSLSVEVVGVVIDPADIYHNKKFLKILPQHEKSSIILVSVPQIHLIFNVDSFPKSSIAVTGSASPLHVSPRISNLQHPSRIFIDTHLQ